MAVNTKRHAVDGADPDRWRLLGLQLRARRIELGYPVRKAFANAKGLITDRGAPNVRMINAMENNERPGTYAPGRLEQFARAYEVTAESVYDLLAGRTDELVPLREQPPAPVQGGALPPAPPGGVIAEAAARPFFDSLWLRLLELAALGTRDPDGIHPQEDLDRWSPSAAQLNLQGHDAEAWNASRGAMSLGSQAWLTADLHAAREARRASERTNGANTA